MTDDTPRFGLVEKPYAWSDLLCSDPLGDVRSVAAHFFDENAALFLTPKSIQHLMRHPDFCNVYKRDWKYVFQVDEVRVSQTGRDYVAALEN